MSEVLSDVEETIDSLLYHRLLAEAVSNWENLYGLTPQGELVSEGGFAHGERREQTNGQSAHDIAQLLLRGLDPWNGKTKDYVAVYSVLRDGVLCVYHHTVEGAALCHPRPLEPGSSRLRPSALAGA